MKLYQLLGIAALVLLVGGVLVAYVTWHFMSKFW